VCGNTPSLEPVSNLSYHPSEKPIHSNTANDSFLTSLISLIVVSGKYLHIHPSTFHIPGEAYGSYCNGLNHWHASGMNNGFASD